jgi:hypothetical protein
MLPLVSALSVTTPTYQGHDRVCEDDNIAHVLERGSLSPVASAFVEFDYTAPGSDSDWLSNLDSTIPDGTLELLTLNQVRQKQVTGGLEGALCGQSGQARGLEGARAKRAQRKRKEDGCPRDELVAAGCRGGPNPPPPAARSTCAGYTVQVSGRDSPNPPRGWRGCTCPSPH